MKTLIVYYSLEGNTDYVAKRIARKLGADLLRLVPVKEYSKKGLRKYFQGGKSVMSSQKPELEEYEADLADYDRVLLGFPVWASDFAPPLRTFVTENRGRLKKKHLAAFACQGGRGAEKALAKLKKAIGVKAFDMEAVFNNPKKKRSKDKDAMIDTFCKVLKEQADAADAEKKAKEEEMKEAAKKAVVQGAVRKVAGDKGVAVLPLLKKAAEVAVDAAVIAAATAKKAPVAAKNTAAAAKSVSYHVKKAPAAVKKAPDAVKSVPRRIRKAPAAAVKKVPAAAKKVPAAAKNVPDRVSKGNVRGFFSHWNLKKHAKFCAAVYLPMFVFDMTVGYVICKKILDKMDEKREG